MIHTILNLPFPLPGTLLPSDLYIADSFSFFKFTSSEMPFLTIPPKVALFLSPSINMLLSYLFISKPLLQFQLPDNYLLLYHLFTSSQQNGPEPYVLFIATPPSLLSVNR